MLGVGCSVSKRLRNYQDSNSQVFQVLQIFKGSSHDVFYQVIVQQPVQIKTEKNRAGEFSMRETRGICTPGWPLKNPQSTGFIEFKSKGVISLKSGCSQHLSQWEHFLPRGAFQQGTFKNISLPFVTVAFTQKLQFWPGKEWGEGRRAAESREKGHIKSLLPVLYNYRRFLGMHGCVNVWAGACRTRF